MTLRAAACTAVGGTAGLTSIDERAVVGEASIDDGAVLARRRSLLVDTWKRLRRLAPPRRVWVVAPADLADTIRDELPGLRPENLIVEPSPRDTGPAVGLACATVQRREPNAIVGIFPTDHVVRNAVAFERTVKRAAAAADDLSVDLTLDVPELESPSFLEDLDGLGN